MADRYRADDREVMETDRPKLNYEEPQTRKDGSRGWLRTNKVPLHDKEGRVIGVLGTYEDITERKRAAETIANERELLRTLLDLLPDSVYIKDLDSRFLDGQQNPRQTLWQRQSRPKFSACRTRIFSRRNRRRFYAPRRSR